MLKNTTPNFDDLKTHANFIGIVKHRTQNFKYLYFEHGASLSLFVFDPQTNGMTLTNACDVVLETIFNHLLQTNIMTKTQVEDLLSSGLIALRDSYGQWAKVSVGGNVTYKAVGPVVVGVRAKGWKDFKFTREYLELFKLLG